MVPGIGDDLNRIMDLKSKYPTAEVWIAILPFTAPYIAALALAAHRSARVLKRAFFGRHIGTVYMVGLPNAPRFGLVNGVR